ncbi:MAG: CcmD family protein [Acidobacteriota bacterium]
MNIYLILAYVFVWLIFMLYAWNLSSRQGRLKKDLDDLKSKVSESASTPVSPKPGS